MINRYRPPDYIQDWVKYVGRVPEEIPQDLLERVRRDLQKFKVSKPTFTIVMIAFNEEDFIFPALASIAANVPSHPTELWVINNNSTDRTQEWLDLLGVRSLLEEEQGWTPARNAGLKEASGEILLSADSDNIYPSQWVNTLTRPLLNKPQVVASCGEYCYYRDSGQYDLGIIAYQWLRHLNIRLRHPKRPHLNCLGGSMAVRRKEAVEVGGYRAQGSGEDGELAFRLHKKGAIHFNSSRQAMAYASLRALFRDGSIRHAFWLRIKKHGARFFAYFTAQKKG